MPDGIQLDFQEQAALFLQCLEEKARKDGKNNSEDLLKVRLFARLGVQDRIGDFIGCSAAHALGAKVRS